MSAAGLSSSRCCWGCSVGKCHGVPQNTGVLGLFVSLAQRSSLQVPNPGGACTRGSVCPSQTRQSLPGLLPTRQQVSGLPVCA